METLGVIDYGQYSCTCLNGYCMLHGSTFKWPTQITITTTPQPTAKGWECPRCTRILAPTTPFCCKAGDK